MLTFFGIWFCGASISEALNHLRQNGLLCPQILQPIGLMKRG
ncbi:hypothetical protein [Leptolyngbya ohadii]|nr:hypothetical protein [Leptolyngbya ohadii]